ncbi:hypothetical protein [Geodermatophilus normandii]|uniref:Uncharacterized protein n=1 Tax=Geodermatophilus normandii TaxID=1137989 RepID=A0A6P0GK41_9ACTN|nr:hypothetical protein [Geodermatophilus normandii]NEM07723.1 hypothetical protein [Geodermatophilus normandii]
MRQDLSGEQWDAVDAGRLSAPTGITYSRRTTRLKRRDAASRVESGCPVVTYWPGGLPERTRLVWHDGEDARAAWDSVRAGINNDDPRPPRGGSVVTAGLWESPHGDALLVLTWHH